MSELYDRWDDPAGFVRALHQKLRGFSLVAILTRSGPIVSCSYVRERAVTGGFGGDARERFALRVVRGHPGADEAVGGWQRIKRR
jgi:hypothetical protein